MRLHTMKRIRPSAQEREQQRVRYAILRYIERDNEGYLSTMMNTLSKELNDISPINIFHHTSVILNNLVTDKRIGIYIFDCHTCKRIAVDDINIELTHHVIYDEQQAVWDSRDRARSLNYSRVGLT